MPPSTSFQWLVRQARDPFSRGASLEGYRSRAAFKLLHLQERFRLVASGDVVVDLGAAPGSWSQVAAGLCGSSEGGGTASAAAEPSPLLGASRVEARPQLAARGLRSSVLHVAAEEMDAVAAAEAEAAAASAPAAASRATAPAATALPARSAASSAGGRRGLVIAVDRLAVKPLPGVLCIQGDFTARAVQDRAYAAVHGVRAGTQALADVLLSDMAHNFTGEAHTDHLRQVALSWSALLVAPALLRPGGHAAIKVRYGDEYRPLLAAMERRFRRVVEVKPPASRSESAEAYLVGLHWAGAARAAHAARGLAGQEEAAALARFGMDWRV